MLVDGKGVTIVFVQPILGAKPHEPLAILEHAKHSGLGKPLFQRDGIKPKVLTRRESGHRPACLCHRVNQRCRWSGPEFRWCKSCRTSTGGCQQHDRDQQRKDAALSSSKNESMTASLDGLPQHNDQPPLPWIWPQLAGRPCEFRFQASRSKALAIPLSYHISLLFTT